MLLDAPRFEWNLRTGRWPRIHNRGETIRVDARGAVECEWKFTSELAYCRTFPGASARLMRAALHEWLLVLADAPLRQSSQPDVSFLIGHRGLARLPHLLLTLRSIAGQVGAAIECIVVEQDSEARIAEELPPWVRYLHQRCDPGEPYSRSRTFNEAVQAARGRIVVPHDNDMLVPGLYAAELVRNVDAGYEALDLKRFIFYLGERESKVAMDRGTLRRNERSEQVIQNLRGGSIALTKEGYERIGGFDESFIGWGGEDLELWERAETLRASRFGYVPIVHLWHAPQPEKLKVQDAPAVKRYYELASVPVQQRIDRLRGLHK